MHELRCGCAVTTRTEFGATLSAATTPRRLLIFSSIFVVLLSFFCLASAVRPSFISRASLSGHVTTSHEAISPTQGYPSPHRHC